MQFKTISDIFNFSGFICWITGQVVNLGKNRNVSPTPLSDFAILLYFTKSEVFFFKIKSIIIADNIFIFWPVYLECVFTHIYRDVTIVGIWLQVFTYALQSMPLSSKFFLACHTYRDSGHPFMIVISEDLWHSHLLPSV